MAKNAKLPVAGSADAVLATGSLERATVEVPEWECAVVVRELARGEARKLAELSSDESEAYIIHTAVIEPAFTEEQAKRLCAEKGYRAVEKILDRILELSGLVPSFRS